MTFEDDTYDDDIDDHDDANDDAAEVVLWGRPTNPSPSPIPISLDHH